MEKKITSMNLTPMMNEEMEVLVRSGEYTSKSDVMKDAFRVFLENKPDKRMLIAIELYKTGRVSLTRAAEIAGIDFERFKEILKDRGIRLRTYSGTKKEMEKGLKMIRC